MCVDLNTFRDIPGKAMAFYKIINRSESNICIINHPGINKKYKNKKDKQDPE